MALTALARSGGIAVSGRIFLNGVERIQPENLAPCQPHAFWASGNGNKRLTGNQKKEKERLTDEAKH
ncbi:hypothetical protein NXV65_21430 [Bacteroides fragilis]|nr:hypothetical protein [Bacteroides fragilis]MCS2886141.1 hypothetical protein [Bacteroides fragilis]